MYIGSHCFKALKACEESGNETENIFISNRVMDQVSGEERIGDMLYALDVFIKPSEECRSAVIPFLCLYTFGLCGTENVDYRPTAAQCMEIRDSICESEWKRAADLLALAGQPPLPDCSSLSDEGLECDGGSLRL